MIHIILCGGSGTRLWPLSREKKPKQFIHFSEGQSLLQRTALGNQQYCSQFMVVCNEDHRFSVEKQLAECDLKPSRTIIEPLPRSTAAAVCLAMFSLDPEEIALVTPADLYIDYSLEYFTALNQAETFAKQGEISIFGIPPHFPETGFGYIELVNGNTVKRFHEKPNVETAQRYLDQGNFFWNSGMICVKAKIFLNQMKSVAPEIFAQSEAAYRHATKDNNTIKIPAAEMAKIPSLSIDHALLEKMPSLKCIIGKFRWSDIGSFDAFFAHLPKDAEGNAVEARNFSGMDAKNNLVLGSDRMITLLDVENLVVVDTPDALLITKRGSTQKVREIVQQLKSTKTTLHREHVDDCRPWGSFRVLESEDKYKVKRLIVSPGKRLSLQKHQHRNEHWVVVAGVALVTVGDQQTLLHPNQSIYIPVGELHRVQNPGSTDLVIIEVQYGNYTGEDDIIRVEDDFARCQG